MTIQNFIKEFQEKKIINTQIAPNAVSDYLKKTLEIKTYLPFRIKRQIVENVVAQNTEWVDGIKKNDAINQYVSFVVAMIGAHTNLEFSDDPVVDYDLLAESGLLPQILAEFEASYSECDILLKLALDMALEDNNLNVLVGKFLNSIMQKIDGASEIFKDKFSNFDIKNILGDFKQEDLAKLSGFLDKFK